MMRYCFSICCLLFLSIQWACFQPDEFSDIPAITDVRVNSVNVDSSIDQIIVTIDFEDGDGDLGATDDAPDANAFIIDNRPDIGFFEIFTYDLVIPDISPQGNVKSISGSIDFTLQPTLCRDVNGNPQIPPVNPADANIVANNELSFEVVIQDRAGNFSNIMTAPTINLSCY